ncbi:hypothetical protein DA099_08925 [Photobacterium damselae]|uniref:Uncharacterized protein n=1 Tax=Photobacterium damselae TaxID=38293 RepID=A0ACD3SU88_PHODM|nr:hypothetical protein DA099_08925 [Photobacterium damselae]TMX63735.1 hypothetical protein DA090_16170 [Photobacterium damselae]TMX70291.1 hypothetical protein DA092_20600 [Photobacterium damselae]
MVINGWCFKQSSPGGVKKTGRNPTDRGKQGVKRSLLTDTNGLPLAIVITGANVHDIKLALDTVDNCQTGMKHLPLNLCVDKGYDSQELRASLMERHFIPHVRSRGEEKIEPENSEEK